MAKKKNIKKEVHVLHDDCKACLRRQAEKNPLMMDMKEADSVTLVKLKGSLPYLKAMTEVAEHWAIEMCEKFTVEQHPAILIDYFEDVMKLIDVFIKMKSEAFHEPIPR